MQQVQIQQPAQNAAVAVQPKQQDPMTLFKSVINASSVQLQFKNALGDHKDAFVASLIDLFTGDSYLQQCPAKLIIAEALRAATLHLPLNKALGFAYIVPFRGKDGLKPTFIPGYKGYIQLAMRTGQYRTINADVVYEGELRKVNKLSGEIAFDGEKKPNAKIVGYFCYFELLNGFSKTLYMTVEDMAKHAKRYSASIKSNTKITEESLIEKANSSSGNGVGWDNNFNSMALKTVVRNLLSKYGYLSVEMQNAIGDDIDREPTDFRNEIISDSNANTQTLDVTNIQYVDADAQTEPEPTEPEQAEQTPPDGPDY